MIEKEKLDKESQTSPRAKFVDSEIQTTWTGKFAEFSTTASAGFD